MNTQNDAPNDFFIDRAITEQEAATIIGVSPLTLRKMRSMPERGGMPRLPYFKYSRRCIRYSLAEVLAWKEAQRVNPNAKVA